MAGFIHFGLAAFAFAAAQPAPADEEIVVTGARPTREAVRSFVEEVTLEADGQIARFTAPLCPAAVGLAPEHNAYIAARLRLVAEHVGAGAAPERCEPNVVVVVADSGGGFLHRLRRERPMLFSALELSDLRDLARLSGPVRAWQLVEPRGADGRPMERISYIQTSPNEPPRYIGRGYRLAGVMPSLTRTPIRQDLAVGLVIFDLEAVEGLTLLQIADHAAMRALARTDPASLAPGLSILGLFEEGPAGAAAAAELTAWDVAYLRALYSTLHHATGQQQRTSIARTMRRELGLEPPRPDP